jgi:hypothetical protein
VPPLSQFELNLARARHLVELYQSLAKLITPAIDISDLLRASLVLGVSALDHFVHEYVRTEMLDVFDGHKPPTDAYHAFAVPMRAVNTALTAPAANAWLDEAIREAHGWRSFQHPDKIADALRLVFPGSLWQEVAAELGTAANNVKTQLAAIVDRRNKIAHEADMDPTYPGTRWPITETLVTDALTFLEQVAKAIEART